MKRRVQPEWLDQLPASDPRAIASRGDLRRINRIMGNNQILLRALRQQRHSPNTIVELGSGDGSQALTIIRRLPQQARHVILLDQEPAMSPSTIDSFSELGCTVEVVQEDIFAWLSRGELPTGCTVLANLFLHHFSEPELKTILSAAAKSADYFVACEPRRAQLALWASHLVGLIGCNAVTRNDAVISVIAGFNGKDLSTLWPEGRSWTTSERWVAPFSHLFTAERVA